jgi:hypothetical protein
VPAQPTVRQGNCQSVEDTPISCAAHPSATGKGPPWYHFATTNLMRVRNCQPQDVSDCPDVSALVAERYKAEQRTTSR